MRADIANHRGGGAWLEYLIGRAAEANISYRIVLTAWRGIPIDIVIGVDPSYRMKSLSVEPRTGHAFLF